MVKKRNKIENKSKEDKKLFAFLATFLSIIGFIIALVFKRKDKYVMYYAKQSLVIFIIGVLAGIVAGILDFIPIMGALIRAALTIIIILVWILSWLYALSGKTKIIPIITNYANKLSI